MKPERSGTLAKDTLQAADEEKGAVNGAFRQHWS